tara:strand:+ start:85 stop:426 length:342 start_codon:yes stop_codon:yes gene_type:complete
MKYNKKKIILFVFGCLLVRFSFVLIAKNINKKSLPLLGSIALIPAIGFLVVYFGNLRQRGALNQKAWWNNLRPIHSLLYFTFAYLAFNKNNKAYIPLLLDVLIGLVAFIHNNL